MVDENKEAREVKVRIIRKKENHAAHSGGAWKVAYADLMTAMMAFFLLMWMMMSLNANAKAGISGYFQEGMEFFNTEKGRAILETHGRGILPGGRGMAPTSGDGQGRVASDFAEESLKEDQGALESAAHSIEQAFNTGSLLYEFKDHVSIDFTDEGLMVQIQDKASQVLFDSGSAQVKPHTMAILKEIARELGKLPNSVVIGGHTDSYGYNIGGRTNWELSLDRANAARRVMESYGLHQGQVRRVTGYANTIPLENMNPADPRNRRISIVVLSSLTQEKEEQRHKRKIAHKNQ